MKSARTSIEMGAEIRAARRERGWTQALLATRAGVSRPALINLERGNPHGEVSTVFRVLAALDLAVRLTAVPGHSGESLDDLLDALGDDLA